MLELAAGLVAASDQPLRQARVLLREQGTSSWPVCLFASSTYEGLDAVVDGSATIAMLNPSAALTLAYRGTGSYAAPQPVRAVGVIPAADALAFAVAERTGVMRFEEIGERRLPLRVLVRGQRDHAVHQSIEHAMVAAGFSLQAFQAWGGTFRYDGLRPPAPGGRAFELLAEGAIGAIFDEAAERWLPAAFDAGMRVLPLADETLVRLESRGYRRRTLSGGVATVDFSGFALFVRADAPDALVAHICSALDARKSLIPWEGDGPLPVERLCCDAPDTPLDVPLHPAAARVWSELGYLPAKSEP